MSLFRPEVREAHARQWLGSVRIARPISNTAITVCAVLVGGLLVSFAVFGEINRKTRLAGLLVPISGSLAVTAPQGGVVVRRPMAEGQRVAAGDVLMVIESQRDSLLQGQVSDTSTRIAGQIEFRQQSLLAERQLRELQVRQRLQTLSDRMATLKAEVRQIELEQGLQKSRLHLAEQGVQRQQHLAASGFVAEAQLQVKQEELIELRVRLQSLERVRIASERDHATLQGEHRSLANQAKADKEQMQRNLSSLEQEALENTARKTVVVRAPQDGFITALNVPEGQAVQAGQTVATLVPTPSEPAQADALSIASSLEAHLYASSRQVGFVKSGQSVFISYDAYPYQKYGFHSAEILNISTTPFAPSELPPNLAQQIVQRTGSQEALYRVNLRLHQQWVRAHGALNPLRPGLTLQADVLQDRRRIWEWVLEPVLAARQKIRVLNTSSD